MDLSMPAGTPATPPSTIPPAVLDLLAAVVEALDIPLPGLTEADEREQHHLMERRTSDVRSTLAAILTHPGPLYGSEAAGIRRRTELTPVTYTVWQAPKAAPEGGEQQ